MIVINPNIKSLGLISISVIWVGLLFVLYKWRGNKSMSFSLHAAQTSAGQIFYFLLFTISLPMFYLFMTHWYIPALGLPTVAKLIVGIGALGQLLAVIVPAIKGRKEQIHNLGAYTMAFTMLPLSILIEFARIPVGVRILVLVGIVYMVSSGVIYALVNSARASYLYFQAAYIASFHLIIISTTYIR